MLVLKLELHSARTGEITEIGRTIIANVGGSSELGNYLCKVARKQPDGSEYSNTTVWKKPLRTGTVTSYPRLRYNVWRLVIRSLLAAFPEERK